MGWFGFNAGSALGANGLASSAFVAHALRRPPPRRWAGCSPSGSRPASPPCWARSPARWPAWWSSRPPAASPPRCSAMLMGLIGGVVCFFAATALKQLLGYDDSLDAFGVHGVGGTLGAILTGVFAVGAVNNGKAGLIDGNAMQVWSISSWRRCSPGASPAVGSLVLLKMVDAPGAACASATEEEYDGLDLTQHGEAGYNLEEASTASVSSVDHGISPADARPEPRPADVPRNGKKHFAVVVGGVPVTELTEAWSRLCQPAANGGPSAEFKAVYPFVTTVSGPALPLPRRRAGRDEGEPPEALQGHAGQAQR